MLTFKLKSKIVIKKSPKIIICFQVLYVCLYRLLMWFGFPSTLSYFTDVLTSILLINIIQRPSAYRKHSNKIKPVLVCYFLLVIIGVFTALINGCNLLQVLWSIRNYYRFLVFFIACICFLKIEDIMQIFRKLDSLFVLNLIVVVVQYFIFQYKGDYLGGIFGVVQGANVYTNVFLIIATTFALSSWMNKNKKIMNVLFIIAGSCLVATLSELKFFFVELIAIYFIVLLLCKKDLKHFLKACIVIVIGIILLMNFLPVLYKLYPNFENFFRFDFIFATHEQGYSMSGDLDRLSAINSIIDKVFRNDTLKTWFGIGLGNAEYSSSQLLVSKFYLQYGYLHYNWFSHAFMMIEGGFIGLFLYVGTFLSVIVHGLREMKKNVGNNCFQKNINVYITSTVVAILCIAIMIYNQSLRTEAAYLIYFILSITYVIPNQENSA